MIRQGYCGIDLYSRDDNERSEGESALFKLRDCVSFIPERERERKKKRRKGRERRRKEDRRGDTPDAPLFL